METLKKEELLERGNQKRYQHKKKKTAQSEIISMIFYI